MKITLTIECDNTTGEINVTGPLANLGLCYSMLELAKDVCREQSKKLKPTLVPADTGEVNTFGRH